ncbi:GSCOCT00014134001.2-RA-CDS [Cotesia congregata]|uniref:Fas-associated death domain like isoform 7_Cc n=1 Tax=Cotesia congregata TaxID=51543 RepID=A0A8J2HPD4_COTCN|nr:GSCOCT00014134001.2-RA-CDS [Cotesia congregata]CAG5107765.1 Fas-associated death domain like isoform 7_Cc [Cotesia congregata]
MTVDMDYLSNWDEYQSRYSHLKQKFLEIASLHVNGTNLENIKLFYDRDINSKRVTDEIKNLADLLKILENRSVLSYNNINVLKEIAETYIKDVVLNQIIKDYETQLQLHQTLPLFNIYKYRSALTSSSAGPEPTQSTGYHQTHTVNLSYNSQPTELKTFQVSDLQAKIFHLVSDNIGRYWRDLARMLDVKEAHIDSIDIKDIPIKDKSFQTLEIFISRCLECDWEKKLIQSLNTIRRKDLAEMVQDVLLKIVEN